MHVSNVMGVVFTHFVSYYLACYPNRNPNPNSNPTHKNNPKSNPNPKLGRLFLQICEFDLFSVSNTDYWRWPIAPTPITSDIPLFLC